MVEPPVAPSDSDHARPAGAAPQPPVPPPWNPSLQLQYATPKPRGKWQTGPDDPLLRALRQVVFAVGLGLLMYGITSAVARVNLRDAPLFAGWGATFVGLATPLWRVRKDE